MHSKTLERRLYELCIDHNCGGNYITVTNAPIAFRTDDGTWWRIFRDKTWSVFEYSARYCAKLADEYFKNGGGY